MHIVFTTYEFPSEGLCGGLGKYLGNISTILSKNGHKVTILLISNRTGILRWKENISVVYVNIGYEVIWHEILANSRSSDRKQVAAWMDMSYSMKKMAIKLHKKFPIDIIQYTGDCGMVYYRVKGIPTVARISSFPTYWRNAKEPYFDMSLSSKTVSFSDRYVYKALNHADAVFGPSNMVAKLTESQIHKKVTVIESPNLIEKSKLNDSIYRKYLDGKKYLLFFGYVSYYKGTHTIAEILYQYLNKYRDYYFVFVGKDLGYMSLDGRIAMMDYIYQSAKEHRNRIIYISPIDKSELLYPVISNSVACILPSRVDNLPNTCIEAMSFGKIVVGTYGASFDELIDDKVNGLLVERDNSEDLLNAIHYLMNMSEDERRIMGQNAKQALHKLGPDMIYNKLIHFYENVINKKNSRKSGIGI